MSVDVLGSANGVGGSNQSVGPYDGRGNAALRGEIVRLPDALLQRLVEGQRPLVVSGTIIGGNDDGTVRLRTPFGEMTYRPPGNVPLPRQVNLQIPAPSPGTTADAMAGRPWPGYVLMPSGTVPPADGRPAATPSPTAGQTPTVTHSTGQPSAAQPPAQAPASPPAGAPASSSAPASSNAPATTGTAVVVQPAPGSMSQPARPPLAGIVAGTAMPAGAPTGTTVAVVTPTPGAPVAVEAAPTGAPAAGSGASPGRANTQAASGAVAVGAHVRPGPPPTSPIQAPAGAPAGGGTPVGAAGPAPIPGSPVAPPATPAIPSAPAVLGAAPTPTIASPPAAAATTTAAAGPAPILGPAVAAATSAPVSGTPPQAAAAGEPLAPPGRAVAPAGGDAAAMRPAISAAAGAMGRPSAGGGVLPQVYGLSGRPAPAPAIATGLAPTGHPAPPTAASATAGQPLPSLTAVLSALMQVDGALAHRVVQAIVPQPNAQLGVTLLFFLAALRGGDVRNWLGERTSRTLEAAGRGELLQRLGGEMASVARQASEPLPGDWRAYSLPLYQDGDLTAARLLVRHRGADDAGGLADGERGGRRFLIDVELSRLGPLQLDGMLKVPRLDLVLRSHRAFPGEDRRTMSRLFADACETCGLGGALSFQPGGQGWVQVASARSGRPTHPLSA